MMKTVDIVIYVGMIAFIAAFIYMVISYTKGLKSSPRELIILFLAKVMEYIAYGSMNLCFVLFLSSDVGLSDIAAGSFIGVWSMSLTLATMFVGSVADAIGIRKTLLVGTLLLFCARLVMPFSTNIYILTFFGFIPLGIGMAMMGPVLSVGIKKYTKPETTALGFALFYTLMNVGWAGGAWIFDFIRKWMGERGSLEFFQGAISISTYQTIFLAGLGFTVLNFIGVYCLREGVEFKDGKLFLGTAPTPALTPVQTPAQSGAWQAIKKAASDSLAILKKVVVEKPFWVYLFMLGTLVFVRMAFYHFHYTFPKYGIRVLGEGVKIGSIFGVLNPVMIVFLTPLVAAMTKNIKSYTLLFVGTGISASALFIAVLPAQFFTPLMNTWVSELVFDRWLEVPLVQQQPIFLALVVMVAVFTVGEAIWSPRLMQFTAEIAPKGKEGAYISLSYLPFFLAKFFAGPLSGWLVATYTPVGATSFPYHYMVWIWIGSMSMISPLALLFFRKLFRKAELQQNEEKREAATVAATTAADDDDDLGDLSLAAKPS
ncbi:MAG: MFS transporter [Oligoflexia bacterium]|nr:MFS transporter [Oligoflexia bacterium]MBF0365131.1 MFS transporter [Oligoflexia bacterium]